MPNMFYYILIQRRTFYSFLKDQSAYKQVTRSIVKINVLELKQHVMSNSSVFYSL